MADPICYKYLIPAKGYDCHTIEKCECVSETPAYANVKRLHRGLYETWTNEYRIRKAGRVFDTWAEAHAELLRRAELDLATARAALQQAQGRYGNVKGMKEGVNHG